MNLRKRKMWAFFLLFFPGGGRKRADFIRKHHLYGSVGSNCCIMTRKFPLYSNLVYLHDNIWVGSDVRFIVHDAIHRMLNYKDTEGKYVEKVGCIEVMNNVFIGSGTRILYNTRIGNNVIIGSGSLVNKDIPDNAVYAGVPAHYICSYDEYVKKHRIYSEQFCLKFGLGKFKGVDEKLALMLYEDFKKQKQL